MRVIFDDPVDDAPDADDGWQPSLFSGPGAASVLRQRPLFPGGMDRGSAPRVEVRKDQPKLFDVSGAGSGLLSSSLEGSKMALSVGQRVTLLRIDDMMAMCHRYELEVRQLVSPTERVGYEGRKQRVAVVRQRGKRKDFYLDLAADDILLDGWGLPFKTDTEAGGVMAGNACFNLIGEPEAIRDMIETRAALPVSNSAKAKIIVSRAERTTCSDDGQELLHPEIDTHHSVVNRMKDR